MNDELVRAIEAHCDLLSKHGAVADTLVLDGVVFTLNATGDGYEYDDPRGAEVVDRLWQKLRPQLWKPASEGSFEGWAAWLPVVEPEKP